MSCVYELKFVLNGKASTVDEVYLCLKEAKEASLALMKAYPSVRSVNVVPDYGEVVDATDIIGPHEPDTLYADREDDTKAKALVALVTSHLTGTHPTMLDKSHELVG